MDTTRGVKNCSCWFCSVLLIVLCFVITTAGYAETNWKEHIIPCNYMFLKNNGNVMVTLEGGQEQIYSPDLSSALSDTYDSIMSEAEGFKVTKGEYYGMLAGDGSIVVPVHYGDVQSISDRWKIGIVLKPANSDNYDYQRIGSNFNNVYYLIDCVDFYHKSKLVGTLSRAEWKYAKAYGDYLLVQDREDNYFFYTPDLQKMDRLEIVKRKNDWGDTSEYYSYDGKIWHQGSGQLAFVPECTLTPDEVQQKYMYRNGTVLDLQGNIVCELGNYQSVDLRFVTGSIFPVRDQSLKYGYCDLAGNQIVPCIYDDLETYGFAGIETIGYAYAKRDGKAGFVNIRTGEETGFDYSSKVCKGYQGFLTVTDLDGSLIVYTAAAGRLAGKYQEVFAPYKDASNPLAVVRDDSGRIGVVNIYGEWIIPLDAGFHEKDCRIDQVSDDGTVLLGYRTIERENFTMTIDSMNGDSLPTGNTETKPEITEAPPQESPETTADTWTCENGHTGNTGKFCTECGVARPVEEDRPWTCPNGHEGNTGKFCPECGAPKP